MTIRYSDDLYAWAQEQASIIEAGQFDKVDRAHVADEINDVAKKCRRDLFDALVEVGRLIILGKTPDNTGIARCLTESPSLHKTSLELAVEAAEHAAILHADDPAGRGDSMSLEELEQAILKQVKQGCRDD